MSRIEKYEKLREKFGHEKVRAAAEYYFFLHIGNMLDRDLDWLENFIKDIKVNNRNDAITHYLNGEEFIYGRWEKVESYV